MFIEKVNLKGKKFVNSNGTIYWGGYCIFSFDANNQLNIEGLSRYMDDDVAFWCFKFWREYCEECQHMNADLLANVMTAFASGSKLYATSIAQKSPVKDVKLPDDDLVINNNSIAGWLSVDAFTVNCTYIMSADVVKVYVNGTLKFIIDVIIA